MKYFGVMITSMKHLMRLLKVSLIALTLVICVAIARRQMSGIINNAAQRDYSKQNNELNQDMTTSVSEILPTVAQVDTSPAQSVADSSGMKVNYQPVKGSGQVVEETVAAGNSASQEYDFPENIYPYRAMLTDNQKLVYDQVYEAVDSRTEEVILCRQLDQTGIANVMEAIFDAVYLIFDRIAGILFFVFLWQLQRNKFDRSSRKTTLIASQIYTRF